MMKIIYMSLFPVTTVERYISKYIQKYTLNDEYILYKIEYKHMDVCFVSEVSQTYTVKLQLQSDMITKTVLLSYHIVIKIS